MQPKKAKREAEAARVLDSVPSIPLIFRPILVSVETAGKLIGCSRTTVYALLRTDLRAVKIGKRTMILYRDLEAFAHISQFVWDQFWEYLVERPRIQA